MKESNNELADVIRNFLPALNKKSKLPAYKLRALDAIMKCRTEYMGGHIEVCEECGVENTLYNSCRNRHCPKCGAIDKEKWIINREYDLLPVRYFHVVFTVPASLNNLFMNNQRQMYNLLFTVSWKVLSDFGKTEKWIGGKIGATAILHTWGQQLNYHPHIHFIVPGGALMRDGNWKHARNRGKYLFSVKQLSSVFRARFAEQLRFLKKEGEIAGDLPDNLFEKDWVVYAKRPFGGPKQVINYLGRYTHRTAISNDRILEVNGKEVRFGWKDYSDNYAQKTTTMPGEKFLGLFVRHISQPGFTRIRHYGFLSSAAKKKSLMLIRKSLGVKPAPAPKDKKWQEIALERMGIKPGICKCCGGKMKTIKSLPNMFRMKGREPPLKIKSNEQWTADQ